MLCKNWMINSLALNDTSISSSKRNLTIDSVFHGIRSYYNAVIRFRIAIGSVSYIILLSLRCRILTKFECLPLTAHVRSFQPRYVSSLLHRGVLCKDGYCPATHVLARIEARRSRSLTRTFPYRAADTVDMIWSKLGPV